MKSNRKIDVSHAEIKTAVVSVKTLTINARQLTLSVFRQIQEDELFVINDTTLSLAGVPWGVVQYHWGDQNRSDLHVLWVKNQELRRSLVPNNGHPRLCNWLDTKEYRYEEKIRRSQYWDFCKYQNMTLHRIKPGEEVNVFDGYDDVDYKTTDLIYDPTEFDWSLVNNQISRFKQNAVDAHKRLGIVLKRLSSLLDSYDSHYKTLHSLDQLFIAV